MRGHSIAIRIPRIKYQGTRSNSPKVCIRGTSESVKSITPKEISRQSKEYIRKIPQYTPIVYKSSPLEISSQTPMTPNPQLKTTFLSFNLENSLKSVNCLKNISNNTSPTNVLQRRKTNRLKKDEKIKTQFDEYMEQLEINKCLALEDCLFPKELNENIRFVPDYTYSRFNSLNEVKRKKRIATDYDEKKVHYSYKNFSALNNLIEYEGKERKLRTSFIQKNKMFDIFPRLHIKK